MHSQSTTFIAAYDAVTSTLTASLLSSSTAAPSTASLYLHGEGAPRPHYTIRSSILTDPVNIIDAYEHMKFLLSAPTVHVFNARNAASIHSVHGEHTLTTSTSLSVREHVPPGIHTRLDNSPPMPTKTIHVFDARDDMRSLHAIVTRDADSTYPTHGEHPLTTSTSHLMGMKAAAQSEIDYPPMTFQTRYKPTAPEDVGITVTVPGTSYTAIFVETTPASTATTTATTCKRVGGGGPC